MDAEQRHGLVVRARASWDKIQLDFADACRATDFFPG